MKRKTLPPIQLGIDVIEGATILARITVNANDRQLFARILREMAVVIERQQVELTPADLKTILKFD